MRFFWKLKSKLKLILTFFYKTKKSINLVDV